MRQEPRRIGAMVGANRGGRCTWALMCQTDAHPSSSSSTHSTLRLSTATCSGERQRDCKPHGAPGSAPRCTNERTYAAASDGPARSTSDARRRPARLLPLPLPPPPPAW